jgi:serine/threonine protein kinase
VNLKIADFGLARTYSIPLKPYTHEVVTLYYRAPEILLGSVEYSPAIDMWSIGCIFLEMLVLKPFFLGTSEKDQYERIFRELGTPNETIWPGITKLKNFNIEKIPDYSGADF